MASGTSRVFLSYDRTHDGDLRDRLVAQARAGTLFSISACSEPVGEAGFDEHVRARIADADVVIVICGERTDECIGMSEELRITREEGKPLLLLWGRREAMCKKPAGSRADDSIYGWTPDIVRSRLELIARTEREVPARLRRGVPAPA
jgi:hypothetical protein